MSAPGVGPEPDPIGKYYRVEEIERLRLDRERRGEPPEPPDGQKLSFGAFFMVLLDKAVNFLIRAAQKGVRSAGTETARGTLLLMKAAFETMMREDRSQDAQFLKKLSHLWLEILEESIALQSKPLKRLIKDIESYPEDEEHTFGYYLDEFAGQNWLPFPYMELIKKLHRQHELDPASSLLTRWTRMIEELLNSR